MATLEAPIDRLRVTLQQEFATLVEGKPDDSSQDVGKLVVRLLRIRIDQAAIATAAGVLEHLHATLQLVAAELEEIRNRLMRMHGGLQFGVGGDADQDSTVSCQHGGGLAVNRLIAEIDAKLEEQLKTNNESFLGLIASGSGEAELGELLHDAAKHTVLGSPTVRRLAAELHATDHRDDQSAAQADSLTPVLNRQGGQYIPLRVCPRRTDDLDPTESASTNEVQVHSDFADTYEIAEAWGLSVAHVAAELVDWRRDYAQLATRIHTRVDITWASLLRADPEASNAYGLQDSAGVDSGPMQATQVLASGAEVSV